MYTRGSAYADFAEGDKGTISAGKLVYDAGHSNEPVALLRIARVAERTYVFDVVTAAPADGDAVVCRND